MSSRRKKLQIGITFLVLIGSLQSLGYLLGVPQLLGLGFVTNASPLPLVFSHFRDTEPFSATYKIKWSSKSGESNTVAITPDIYARMEGPYNLRNVYGAAFAVGPTFTADPTERNLWETVMRRAFCDPATIAHVFNLPSNIEKVELIVTSRARGKHGTWNGKVSCS